MMANVGGGMDRVEEELLLGRSSTDILSASDSSFDSSLPSGSEALPILER